MRQGAAVRRTPTDDWWSGGGAPMLVVQGLDDRIAPPANGRALRDERVNTTLIELDGAGHALLPEQPDAIGAAVLDFLQQRTLGQRVRGSPRPRSAMMPRQTSEVPP